MKKEIIKKLEAIAEEFGAENLTEVIGQVYTNNFEPEGGDHDCASGFVWSSVLKKCVPDIG